MYSGVFPNKHLMWFVWKYAPNTSPFKWLKSFSFLEHLDSIPLRLLLHKVTTYFEKRTAFWGIPRIVHLPIRYWPNIDVSEKLFWDETGYLENYPTIFEFLRKYNVAYETVGMTKTPLINLVTDHQFTEITPWTYIFIGEVDGLSHQYRQDSPIVI
jgi:hypothetical protein